MAFAPLPPFYTYLTYTQRRLDPNAGYTGYTTAKGEKEAAPLPSTKPPKPPASIEID